MTSETNMNWRCSAAYSVSFRFQVIQNIFILHNTLTHQEELLTLSQFQDCVTLSVFFMFFLCKHRITLFFSGFLLSGYLLKICQLIVWLKGPIQGVFPPCAQCICDRLQIYDPVQDKVLKKYFFKLIFYDSYLQLHRSKVVFTEDKFFVWILYYNPDSSDQSS